MSNRPCEVCGDKPCSNMDCDCSKYNNYSLYKSACFKRYKKTEDCNKPSYSNNGCWICANLKEETKLQWEEIYNKQKSISDAIKRNKTYSPMESNYELYYKD